MLRLILGSVAASSERGNMSEGFLDAVETDKTLNEADRGG